MNDDAINEVTAILDRLPYADRVQLAQQCREACRYFQRAYARNRNLFGKDPMLACALTVALTQQARDLLEGGHHGR